MLQNSFLKNDDTLSGYKEGELYKVVNVHGRIFELRYGYYEECERENPAVDPMPLYPDFLKEPQYTEEGYAIVTMMQDSCRYYKGEKSKFRECGDCAYFHREDELFGICTCKLCKQSVSVIKTDSYV